MDYYTFDVKGGRLDVFSALIYVKGKYIPLALSSIEISYKLRFKNKQGEILYSTTMNSCCIKINDTTNWYEQLVIGQAPCAFEKIELEVFNTNAEDEQIYFDVVLYKGNLGVSYFYDTHGNVIRVIKGKELKDYKKTFDNKIESTSHVICSYDENKRLIQTLDINDKKTLITYDNY